ncbi:hypothetical protein [uncultured Dokdonia sp.]|uniref:hypothetical protein n=1 Tax=uncultured Dokdonia sp. TaxID=575653 RepID=UPI00262ABAA7|nr:hypothetical protein [uncultured Dokdonia sp.]
MGRKNPFKEIGYPKKEVPKELRKKVLNDVAAVKLLIDMNSLFTANYKNTFSSIFFTEKRSNQTN